MELNVTSHLEYLTDDTGVLNVWCSMENLATFKLCMLTVVQFCMDSVKPERLSYVTVFDRRRLVAVLVR